MVDDTEALTVRLVHLRPALPMALHFSVVNAPVPRANEIVGLGNGLDLYDNAHEHTLACFTNLRVKWALESPWNDMPLTECMKKSLSALPM